MEALLRTHDALQERFLFRCRHDLVLPGVCVALVLGEVLAEHLHEILERQVLVLIEVEELL